MPVAIVLLVRAIRRSWTWARGRIAPGKILALALPVLALAIAGAGSVGAPGPLDLWAQQRAKLEKRLQAMPGRQLVIVHYGPQHDFYEEWVENRADLQGARVIWARERSAEQNCRLMASYPGRTVWLLEADRNHLEKYTSDCSAGNSEPAPGVPVLQSLPDR